LYNILKLINKVGVIVARDGGGNSN